MLLATTGLLAVWAHPAKLATTEAAIRKLNKLRISHLKVDGTFFPQVDGPGGARGLAIDAMAKVIASTAPERAMPVVE